SFLRPHKGQTRCDQARDRRRTGAGHKGIVGPEALELAIGLNPEKRIHDPAAQRHRFLQSASADLPPYLIVGEGPSEGGQLSGRSHRANDPARGVLAAFGQVVDRKAVTVQDHPETQGRPLRRLDRCAETKEPRTGNRRRSAREGGQYERQAKGKRSEDSEPGHRNLPFGDCCCLLLRGPARRHLEPSYVVPSVSPPARRPVMLTSCCRAALSIADGGALHLDSRTGYNDGAGCQI